MSNWGYFSEDVHNHAMLITPSLDREIPDYDERATRLNRMPFEFYLKSVQYLKQPAVKKLLGR
jgi:hypothetical protein